MIQIVYEEKSAIAWMQKQAKEIDSSIDEDASLLQCSRIILFRIEELQNFIKELVDDGQGSVFMLKKAKKLIT